MCSEFSNILQDMFWTVFVDKKVIENVFQSAPIKVFGIAKIAKQCSQDELLNCFILIKHNSESTP